MNLFENTNDKKDNRDRPLAYRMRPKTLDEFYGQEEIVGENEMKNIPFGAVALYTLADKLSAGLKQFMAGARKFNLKELNQSDLMSANRETEEVTGIPYMLEAKDQEAKKIIKS